VKISALAATLACLLYSLPLRAQSAADFTPATLTVLVYNFVGVPARTLTEAERQASTILAAAGARADWVDCGSRLPKATEGSVREGLDTTNPGPAVCRGNQQVSRSRIRVHRDPQPRHGLLRENHATRAARQFRLRASGAAWLRHCARTGSLATGRAGAFR
jgi:hypothetical protein